MIAASVYSATGVAFASAALVTSRPRCQMASETIGRTLPGAVQHRAQPRGGVEPFGGELRAAPGGQQHLGLGQPGPRGRGVEVLGPDRVAELGQLVQPPQLVRPELEPVAVGAHHEQRLRTVVHTLNPSW